MMRKMKPLLHLLALMLCLSCLLSLGAVPVSRSLAALSNQGEPVVEMADQAFTREGRVLLQEYFGRMDIESNDYPGSGANPRHDPRTPGRP